jgi:hypothetical protein
MALLLAFFFLKPPFRALFAFNVLRGGGKRTRSTGETFDGTGVGGVVSFVARDSPRRTTLAVEPFGAVLGAVGHVDKRARGCADTTRVAGTFVAGTFPTMFARGLT